MSFSEWKKVKLGDVAEVLSGYAFKTKDFVEEGIPVVKIKNIVPPVVDISDTQYVSEELYKEKTKYSLEYNDILISMTGSHINQLASAVGKIGRVKLVDQKLLLNQRVGKLYVKDSERCDQEYLYYFLTQDNIRYDLAASAGGSANQANISPQNIRDIDILLPQLEEQKAIANILSSLDEKIELNNQMNKTLEEMAQALFKRWFVDFEFPNEDGEPYKSSGGEMIDSELGMIPQEWEITNIKALAEVTDYVANGSFASLKENVTYCDEQGYAVLIRLVDYNKGFQPPFTFVDERGYKFLKKSSLNGGEIIISNVGANAGTVFKAPKMDTPMTLGPNSIMLMKSEHDNYLYALLSSYTGQEKLKAITTGSAQPKFNKTDFRNIKVVRPNASILRNYNVVIESIEAKIEQNNKEKQNLCNIRDTLLPKLMSGQIRVTDLQK